MRRYKLRRRRKLIKKRRKGYKRNQKSSLFGFKYSDLFPRQQKGGFFGFNYLGDILMGKNKRANKVMNAASSYLGI